MNTAGTKTIETEHLMGCSDMVTHEQYAKLFNDMHPGFFERDYIQRVPEDEPASEILLRLQSFDEKIYDKKFEASGMMVGTQPAL